MVQRIYGFIKREAVFAIACGAALVSAFIEKPSKKYIHYIDFSVLAVLFCLMLVVAGLIKSRMFDVVSAKILNTTHDLNKVAMVLVNITFFSAMLVTNDVALITFVPLTIGLFGARHQDQLIYVVVMETIAANLGSMMTPIGNPQNLFLYTFFNMDILDFFKAVLPVGVLSFILMNFIMAARKNKSRVFFNDCEKPCIDNKYNLIINIILFLLCILTVLRVIDYRVCLAINTIAVFLIDKSLFKKVDYTLLLTFVAFFIFVGNLSNIGIVRTFSSCIVGKELFFGIFFSQVISNVPAAILLSGFTKNAKDLVAGVDIGGLGTLVASLASLISYKFYARSKNADTKKYLKVFTFLNFIFLIILTAGYLSFNIN